MVKLVILMSGKRKSGKDYCSLQLKQMLENTNTITTASVSHSLKLEFAHMRGLNYAELITDGPYKEIYRLEMIKWGEEMRNKDPAYFCRQTIPLDSMVDVVIVTDCRRPSDMEYYGNNYRTLSVRVECPDEERRRRGFVFTPAVDEAPSECALDGWSYDERVCNDGDTEKLEKEMERVEQTVRDILKEE